MPRRPTWPPIPRRAPRSGSLSRNQATGEIRARLPRELSPGRASRKFRPHELREAVAWLDGEVGRLQAGAAHDAGTPFVEWGSYWLETAIEPFKPPGTVRAYTLHLRRAGALLALPVGEIRASHVRRELGLLAKRLAPGTVQGAASVWRSCFQSAIEDEVIDRNPVGRFKLEGERKKGEGRRGWTAREIRALWAAIRGHRMEGGFALILGCGLRLGEACGLAWADVDLEGKRAYIHQQWTMARHRETLKGRNPHWIPLPEPVVHALIRHRDSQAPGATLVWERGTTGRPWGQTRIREDWRAICEAAGLEYRVPHSGRHSMASILRAGNVPAEAVAELLGHASISTTWEYTKADAESIRRAQALIGELLGEPES